MRARAAAGLSLAVAIACAPPAGATVHLSAVPRLLPPFQATAHDYVSRCRSGLTLSVNATGGDRVAVAHRPERGGTFAARVERRTGEAVEIRARSAHGRVRIYHVRCLPESFPAWTVARHGRPQAEWYVTTPVSPPSGGYVAIFDAHGAPVWWHRSESARFMPWDAKLLPGGLLAWGHNFGDPFGTLAAGAFEERTLDDRRVRLIRTRGSPTDMHDLERLPDGHLLAITYRPRDGVDMSRYGWSRRQRVFDGMIQELTPGGGVAWRWSSRGHVSPSETQPEWRYRDNPDAPPALRGVDLVHINSVEPHGDGLIVSGRHLNAIFRIDRPTGAVDWKLGGSFVPGESLGVVGSAADRLFGGQHDARVLDDGTVTVYDNRARADGPPAAERFRIDPVARTATRIEHVTNPAVRRSGWGGSARKLPGGDWVIWWGGTGLMTEQTPAGRVVLALRLSRDLGYQAQPLPPGRLSAGALRDGMDAIAARRASAAVHDAHRPG